MTSVTGAPLTNARTISRTLIHDADRPHPTLNLLFMQFGQMLTHDVTQSASITTRMFDFKLLLISSSVFLSFVTLFYFQIKVMVRQFDAAVKVIFDFQGFQK